MNANDIQVSFLPLAHMYEQMIQVSVMYTVIPSDDSLLCLIFEIVQIIGKSIIFFLALSWILEF